MDDCRTINFLRTIPELQKLNIDDAWNCSHPYGGIPERYSTRPGDLPIVGQICKIMGVDGYAAKDLPTRGNFFGQRFHAELYLCSGAGLEYVRPISCGICKPEYVRNLDKARGVTRYSMDHAKIQKKRIMDKLKTSGLREATIRSGFFGGGSRAPPRKKRSSGPTW
jgi:hypothetical protein